MGCSAAVLCERDGYRHPEHYGQGQYTLSSFFFGCLYICSHNAGYAKLSHDRSLLAPSGGVTFQNMVEDLNPILGRK